MSNQARNIIKKSTLNHKQKKLKEYRKECRYEFGNALPPLVLPLVFSILSLTDNSIYFSSFLAIFSVSLTLAFEKAEWKKFAYKKKLSEFDYNNIDLVKFPTKPFIYVLPATTAIYAAVLGLIVSFKIPIQWQNYFPNLFTSIGLTIYSFSYTWRCYRIRKYYFTHQK